MKKPAGKILLTKYGILKALKNPGARINQSVILGVLIFIVLFGLLSWIQFSTPDLAGNDGYYHIKMAYLMRQQGLKPAFPWLPLTILNSREFYDHHFLFHVFMIPFTYGDLILGAKWASVVFAALAFLAIWWLLYIEKIPFSWLWAFGLLGVSSAFLYRMSIPRAQSLSLAILVIGLIILLKRKYFWLIPVSFLYVWSYDGFPLMIAVAVCFTVAQGLVKKDWTYKPVLYTILGIGLGLLINPYFPNNVIFIWRHLLPKLSGATDIRVGNEWYPYRTATLLENTTLGLILFVCGIVALGMNQKRMDVRTATSLLSTILFGVMLFQARRFVEYFPPFSLIFASFAFAPFISFDKSRDHGTENSRISKFSSLRHKRNRDRWVLMTILAGVVIVFGWSSLGDARDSMNTSKSYDLYAQASSWLQMNTEKGDRVFQTDWDDFTRLFYYNTDNTYLVGLDPSYMQLYNADLYDLWVDITQGKVDNLAEVIYTQFGGKWILSDLKHNAFIKKAEADPGLDMVYKDDQAVIFHILDDMP